MSSTEPMVKFRTSDGETKEAGWAVFRQFGLFAPQDDPELRPRDEIPLANVSSAVLDKIIEYCEHHKNDPPTRPDSSIYSEVPKLDKWDQKFVQMENELLLNVIMAANYLDIKPLLNAACKGFGESIKGKTPMQIGSMLGAVSDFTPEEEAQIRKAEGW